MRDDEGIILREVLVKLTNSRIDLETRLYLAGIEIAREITEFLGQSSTEQEFITEKIQIIGLQEQRCHVRVKLVPSLLIPIQQFKRVCCFAPSLHIARRKAKLLG
jgi:hypothetical protein